MAELKPFIAKVANRQPLSREEARAAFDILMSGEATPSQIGGFLMALRVRGETVPEIVGAVETMRDKMLRIADEHRLPFEIKAPSASSRQALAEIEAGKVQRFATVDDLMADLHADD